MSNIGIPVPPGFTITTDVCTAFYANGKRLPKDVVPAVEAALRKVESLTGKKLGSAMDPLLV